MKIKLPLPVERSSLESSSHQVLVELVLRQQEVIEQLVEELERLKCIISSDSQTSSKPPSSDIHKRSEQQQESPSEGKRRSPGAQKGHEGKTRLGFGRIDRYEVLRPQECPVCGSQSFSAIAEHKSERIIAELSPCAIEVVCYQQQHCRCHCCESLISEPFPGSVIGHQSLGAKLQSLLGWLGHYAHLSYEKQQEFLSEFGQISVGVGTLQQTSVRLVESLNDCVAHLKGWVRSQGQVQVDESPWLVNGVKEWMWVVCGEGFSVFHAGDSRSRAELATLLGEQFAGVLISDDYSVYNGYRVDAQQKCLAHLRRHFKQLCKLKGKHNGEIGQVFLGLIDEAFRMHRQWRQGQDEGRYHRWAQSFKQTLQLALEQWLPQAGYAAGLLLRSLRDKAAQWWYFLEHPQVPPDNNRAERSLRLAVTKRKVCGGSRSMDGFEQTAALLTVIQTCRAQGRSALKFLHQAMMAHYADTDIQKPSLIPGLDT